MGGARAAGERLQKILARAGVASRRKAEELIRAGRVTVNGEVAAIGQSADPEKDAIKVDGKMVHLRGGRLYYLLNKPSGVMTTRSDPEGRPTIVDLIPGPLRKILLPVGRLDFHTEGLLLLTDDGDLANRLAHPRYGCTKTYEVKVKGEPIERDMERLRNGIMLNGRRTAPARIESQRKTRGKRVATRNSWLTIELLEGRSRQIREMFFRIGHPVQRLRRVSIGPLRDPHLMPGSVRELNAHEVDQLRRSSASRRSGPSGRLERSRRGTSPKSSGASPRKGDPRGRRRPPKTRRDDG